MLGVELIIKEEIVLDVETDPPEFHFVNAVIHQLLSQADVHLHSVIGCNNSAVVVVLVLANCSFEIAAVNQSCLVRAETNIQVGDGRVLALLAIPKFGTAITAAIAKNVPFDAAIGLSEGRKPVPHLHVISGSYISNQRSFPIRMTRILSFWKGFPSQSTRKGFPTLIIRL